MSKQRSKGTAGETQLKGLLAARDIDVVRNPMGARTDLSRKGFGDPVRVLATRPDYGRWLFTMDLDTFADILPEGYALEIECKRRKKLSIHSMFDAELT